MNLAVGVLMVGEMAVRIGVLMLLATLKSA